MAETTIEADPTLPIIRLSRDFDASAAHLFRAHTDPEIFVRWIGPDRLSTRVDYWDATSGGRWRYVSSHDSDEYAFHGCFHEVRPDKIIQTFTFDAEPDGVALQTLWFDDLGGGRSRLRSQSLVDNLASRDAWLRSGMEVGVDQGYAALQRMITDGDL